MSTPVPPLLTARALNRATLARQLLLERASLEPVAAVEALAGLQAQEPASPYLALWTRLAAFDPAALDRAIHARALVKTSLMRLTLHLVSANDYRRLIPAIQSMLRPSEVTDVDAIAASAIRFAATPRSNTELRDHVGALAPSVLADDVWGRVRRKVPFLHVPADVPWSFGRRPSLVAASAWLPQLELEGRDAALEHLARRYFAAFGPATIADFAAWTRLAVVSLRPAVKAISAELIELRDDGDRILIDARDAPRPDESVPAPPRLLPMWDSLLLAHADRTRIMTNEHRALVIARNGDTLPSFLVDGRVAGLWWASSDGQATTITLEPFGRLAKADRVALEAEATDLSALLATQEPAAYARYQRSGARRFPGTITAKAD